MDIHDDDSTGKQLKHKTHSSAATTQKCKDMFLSSCKLRRIKVQLTICTNVQQVYSKKFIIYQTGNQFLLWATSIEHKPVQKHDMLYFNMADITQNLMISVSYFVALLAMLLLLESYNNEIYDKSRQHRCH